MLRYVTLLLGLLVSAEASRARNLAYFGKAYGRHQTSQRQIPRHGNNNVGAYNRRSHHQPQQYGHSVYAKKTHHEKEETLKVKTTVLWSMQRWDEENFSLGDVLVQAGEFQALSGAKLGDLKISCLRVEIVGPEILESEWECTGTFDFGSGDTIQIAGLLKAYEPTSYAAVTGGTGRYRYAEGEAKSSNAIVDGFDVSADFTLKLKNVKK